MIALAALVGYLIGSMPTANVLAGLWGIDLRTSGSHNPGANNARRLGGPILALLVFVVEIGKGRSGRRRRNGTGWGPRGGPRRDRGCSRKRLQRLVPVSGRQGVEHQPRSAPCSVAHSGPLRPRHPRSRLRRSVARPASAPWSPWWRRSWRSLVWDQMGLGTGWGVSDTSVLVVLGVGLPMVLWQRHWADARTRLRRPAPL